MPTAVFRLQKKSLKHYILWLEQRAVRSSLVLPCCEYLFLSLRQTKVENFVFYIAKLALTEGHSISSVVERCLHESFMHLFRSLRTSNSALGRQAVELEFSSSLWKTKQRTDHTYVYTTLCYLRDVHLVFCTSWYFLWAKDFMSKSGCSPERTGRWVNVKKRGECHGFRCITPN